MRINLHDVSRICFLTYVVLCNTVAADTRNVDALYIKAKAAILAKDHQIYYQFKPQLKALPLYGYFQYLEIKTEPGSFKKSTIDEYLHNDKNEFFANLL